MKLPLADNTDITFYDTPGFEPTTFGL
ncbi:MAG TPA: hypothetical protein ACHBY5_10915 [Arsenophonus apicola]